MANSYPKDDASHYESGEEWEIGLGNLIIDLDADLEKETMSTQNNLKDVSPFRIGKMKIKRKVSAKADGTAHINDDFTETSQGISEEKSTKSRKRETFHSKIERTGISTSLCEISIEEGKPKNECCKDKEDNNETNESKEENKNEGKKKTKESSEKKTKKSKIDKQPSFEHVGIDTSEVGTLTEPDKLGPCEPGTSVNLEGIVWHETPQGVLVVNVTWRNKTYVGTLMDCTKHDWAPPRFCESPVNDIEGKGQISKGRPKRSRTSSSITDLSNYTETRSSIHCKLRTSTNGKGRRGNNIPIATISNQEKHLNGKRKAKTFESELNSGDDKVVKKIKNSKIPSPVGSSEGISTPYTTSQGLIECPEPNCSKKYKHINGLRYHQTHAHHDIPKKPQEILELTDFEENYEFTSIDTKELETEESKSVDCKPETENKEETEIDAIQDRDVVALEEDNYENVLPNRTIDSGDEIFDMKENTFETNADLNVSEDVSTNFQTVTEFPVNANSVNFDIEEKLSKIKNAENPLKCKTADKDLSVFDFNSAIDSEEQTLAANCNKKASVSVIKPTVKASNSDKNTSQPFVVKTEPISVTISTVNSPVATCDQQKHKKIEKEKSKLQEKLKKTKPEKILIKPKPNRPIAPAPQITQQLIAFPAVVTAPVNAAATMTMPPVTTKPQATVMGSSTLKPIQPKPTVMGDLVVNPALANLKEKKLKSKKRMKEKEREVDKNANPSFMKESERKISIGKIENPVKSTGPNITQFKRGGLNPTDVEPNILKQALTQSGINLDDYNSSSPSGSESNEPKDANKDLPNIPASSSSTTTIPEPPKLIRTSSLPVKQQSAVITQPTQPKPLQQFEKNMAEKPVMSVLPAVKGTTVRPPEDNLPPRVIIPQPLTASPEQNRVTTQSPAYSDISDANEEDTAARDRSIGLEGVLASEQRSFFPGYSGVIVRDRSHSPLKDGPSRPEMPKLIPKQRTNRDIDVDEGPDNEIECKEENNSTKPSLYQHPQLYTPHPYPPIYFGYRNHMDPAASPLRMIAKPPYGHPRERMEKELRDKDLGKSTDSKRQRNTTHSKIETEIIRIDKNVKSERTDEIRDKQVENHRILSDSIELKPHVRILSPQESSRHYDCRLPQSYYMYPHAQWEESRCRELDDRRKSKAEEGKHPSSSSQSEQRSVSRGQEEGKNRCTPESASSASCSKTLLSNVPQDKRHKMDGPFSQYLPQSYMVPYSVVDDQYRQPVVAYPQYLTPEFGYSAVWKSDDKRSPVHDPKHGKLMAGHSSTSPRKLKEILPDGKNALEVLKQRASQFYNPQKSEQLRSQDSNQTSPHKSVSPTQRKTPESIEELSRFDGSGRNPLPQMQHLHMHHHTHLGYPMMPYGQIIAGNHPQAATTSLNPYSNARE
ncbi:zinc finger protein 608-like [Anneissia japonica]|uniref:zinc finger protein 608-like n=1 Tax=Anneissia japonica TaxID=1529436 RepID=UPI0014259DBF|nr:zinc finger protein 608-like [Anneissia japonica]XP_033106852.1 zinc finger protein 608-like [Anneissia japonica]XP_033106858.1 zinc finger protein 608-like [Anneissia japonica]